MKNTIKLSLVAAVAVSTLSAGSLENAIKDTTISGKALIGYNYTEVNNVTANQTEYDFDITLNTKVNDTITFQIGVEADHVVAVSDQTTDIEKGNGIGLTKLNFTAKTDMATVIVGKQKQPTPFMDDERGDGVVALVPAGPVTVALGHFTGMNATALGDNKDISAAAVIGAFGPVNASLWYANLSTIATAYSLNVNGTFDIVNVDFTHSSADYDKALAGQDATLTKLVASAKVADVNLVLGYGMTNDNNIGRGVGVNISADNDGKTDFAMDQIHLDDHNDANAYLLGASMTFGATTVGANYLVASMGSTQDASELDISAKYAMSKNFSITGLYSDATVETTGAADSDDTRMELSLNYKF